MAAASDGEARATFWALSNASFTRPENIWSKPRLSVTAAKIATKIAGTTAMTENQVTSRHAAGRQRDRATLAPTRESRQPITAASDQATSVRLTRSNARARPARRLEGRQVGAGERIGDAGLTAPPATRRRLPVVTAGTPHGRHQSVCAPLWERRFALTHVSRCKSGYVPNLVAAV